VRLRVEGASTLELTGEQMRLETGPVTWTDIITSPGNVTLSQLAVLDGQIGATSFPQSVLGPGAAMRRETIRLSDDLNGDFLVCEPGVLAPQMSLELPKF
jgi:hypothetical protein